MNGGSLGHRRERRRLLETFRVTACFLAMRRGGVSFNADIVRGSGVMAAKSFMMMVGASLIGPALGIGLFILLNNL